MFVELRQATGLAVRYRERRAVLAVRPHVRPLDTLRGEHILEPTARMAAEHRHHPDVLTECMRGARDVQALPARRLDEPGGAVDVAADQAIHLEQLVDGRVRCQADDHVTDPRSIASSASTMVG